MRIQFYPSPELEAKLNHEAKAKNVSVNTLVIDALNSYYGLLGPNTKSETELISAVFEEIAAYVNDPDNFGTEFDINSISDTYSKIDMTYAGKPKAIKARIGKAFAKKVGKSGDFENVTPIYLPNGAVKKSRWNRAALYRVLKK